MSSSTGTSASASAFFTTLVNYLTSDTTLGATEGLWTKAWSASDTELVLQAPSTSGLSAIYVGLKLVTDTGTEGGVALALYGMTGVLAGAKSVDEHINVSPAVWMYLDDSNMNYWITASARRIMCVVQISTIFESCYAGLFLPFGDPTYYSYPYAIGGSSSGTPATPQTYRSQTNAHSNFINPATSTTLKETPSLYVMVPSGTWLPSMGTLGDLPASSYIGVGPNNYVAGVDPNFGVTQGAATITDTPTEGFGYANYMARLVPFYDATVSMQEVTLCMSTGGVLGTLDGIYRISGKSAAAADTVTISDSNYLVSQNAYRTDENSFFAMQLDAGSEK